MLWLFTEVSHISDPFLIGLAVKYVDDTVYRIGLVLLYLKLEFQGKTTPSFVSSFSKRSSCFTEKIVLNAPKEYFISCGKLFVLMSWAMYFTLRECCNGYFLSSS